VDALVEISVLVRSVEQHDDEQEQDHDRAGVNDDLDHGHKRRIEQNIQA
jgi:hypothetical protein